MIRFLAGLAAALVLNVAAQAEDARRCPPALDFDKRLLHSEQRVNLCDAYLGKVVLVVNTASKCGFTHQYDGLEALYEQYRARGLVVLGFPSNDFGGQEPGSEAEIQAFCRATYGIEFPLFEKTHAAEAQADPLYRALAAEGGTYPSWNFHKYLLDRNGRVVKSFPTATPPQSPDIVAAIEALL